MPGLRINTSQTIKTRVVGTVMGTIRLTEFLTLPENEFHKYVKEVENDPLFAKLVFPDKSEERVITYNRFPRTGAVSKHFELSPHTTVDATSPDVESVIEKNRGIIKVIRRIGIEKFKKYYVYNEGDMGIEDISRECGVSMDETRRIMSMVNEVSVIGEFFQAPGADPEKAARYWKIADIASENGDFEVKCHNLSLARGKYSINYKRLLTLKEKGALNEKDMSKVNRLISKLELINARKIIVCRVIQLLLKEQKAYFLSGKDEDLSSFKQRDASGMLTITPGVLSRAISGKSIVTPQGKEVPLKDFFPSRKDKNKEILRKILEEKSGYTESGRDFSDNLIRKILNRDYGINLSRRSICQYRSEIS